jgi:ectoine hydroxylase-related dioxygenase (phytanoyl-CoA dioxygenase family)
MISISEAQRAAFERDGYLVLHDLVDVGEVARVRDIAARLVAARAGWERGDFFDLVGNDSDDRPPAMPQLLMPQRYSPELAHTGLRVAAERIASELLGAPPQAEGEHVICKSRRTSPPTPLHQDEAFWSGATEYRSLSIWFPLLDARPDNGCLRFVPGSHRGPVLDHHIFAGDPTNNSIEVDAPERFAPVDAHCPAGGATVHHCRTIHGAHANRSEHHRLAYIFGFGLPARRLATPRPFPWNEQRRLLREERARSRGYEPTRMRPEL